MASGFTKVEWKEIPQGFFAKNENRVSEYLLNPETIRSL